jgi:hypothetical protein
MSSLGSGNQSVRSPLPVNWRLDDWTMLVDRRLTAEAMLRASRSSKGGADGMDATQIRRILGLLVRTEDVVISAALECARVFDDAALDADGIDLGLMFEEVHIIRTGGSIELHASLRARVARRMIFGRRRNLLRKGGSSAAIDPSEPLVSEYAAVFSPGVSAERGPRPRVDIDGDDRRPRHRCRVE